MVLRITADNPQFIIDDTYTPPRVVGIKQRDGSEQIFPSGAAFSAHKNGTNQTDLDVTGATNTKLTFGTEVFDKGGYYDAANSKWTPPAGLVRIRASFYASGLTANSQTAINIYKNGVAYKAGLVFVAPSGTTAGWTDVDIIDEANGTDYYEVYGKSASGTTITVSGLATLTHFMGHSL